MQEHATSNPPAVGREKGFRPIRKFLFSLEGVTLLLVLLLAIYPGWNEESRLLMIGLFVAIIITAITTRHASMLCRCILPLIIGGMCVEIYTVIHEHNLAPDLIKYFVFSEHHTENFYAAAATLYAIITALALVKGIEDFDQMKRIITDEAYKVRAVSQMTHYFDESARSETHTAIRSLKLKLMTYARNVAALRDQDIKDANLGLLRDCQRDIAQLIPEDANDRYALRSIMEAHGELGTLRSKRIGAIGEKMPPYLMWALWLMALGLILPFMSEPLMKEATAPLTGLVPNDARFGQYSIIFLLAAVNSFLLLMLADISDPFDGFWMVNLGPFHELSDALELDMSSAERVPASAASFSPGTLAGSSSSSRI
jgi:hypothetical protein